MKLCVCEQLIGTNICGTIMSIQDRKLYWDCFGERCCGSCRLAQGSDWDLITRTEVLSEYLIPVDSIQLMKFSTRPNPHNPQWTAMKLFLRRHARLKAYTRFGGADELEREITRRKQIKFEKEFAQSNDIFNTNGIAAAMTSCSSSSIRFDDGMTKKDKNNNDLYINGDGSESHSCSVGFKNKKMKRMVMGSTEEGTSAAADWSHVLIYD
jgi:hypothetical protein